jgi:hypothetical protein
VGSELDVVRTVISRVGGRQRRVRVTHPWHAAERPGSALASGVAAGAMAVVLTCLAAPLLSSFVRTPVPKPVALVFGCGLAIGAVAAAYVAVRAVYAGARNITGRHTVEGVVVDRLSRQYGEEIYSVAVDDGTRDEIVAWTVDKATYDRLVEGTRVEAVVSADARYVYHVLP